MKDLQSKYEELRQQFKNNLIRGFQFNAEKHKLLMEAKPIIVKALNNNKCDTEFRTLFPKLINQVWFVYEESLILPIIEYENNCVYFYFRIKLNRQSPSTKTNCGFFITPQNKVCFISDKDKKLTRRFIARITSYESLSMVKMSMLERFTRKLIKKHGDSLKEVK